MPGMGLFSAQYGVAFAKEPMTSYQLMLRDYRLFYVVFMMICSFYRLLYVVFMMFYVVFMMIYALFTGCYMLFL